jgi:hypothetical protein
MIFENYKDYLLSLNIAQISREFGFKKMGMNSFYLLTNVIRKFIERISVDTQKQVEDSGRNECNIIDILYTLLDDKNISQKDIMLYINSSKIKYDFTKNNYIHKLISSEEKERNKLIKKINYSSLKIKEEEDFNSINLNPNLIKAIPPMLRYFPLEYKKGGLNELNEDDENKKKINIINNMLEDKNKINTGTNLNERKNVEELNSTANYFDLSKKHSFHKKNIDFSKIFNNVILIKDNFVLGKKHSRYLIADKQDNNNENENEKDEDEENDEIFNEETGNINQRMSNFSSFEDNLSLFHHKFSINGIKEKEKRKIISTYRKTTNTNFIENSIYNKIISTEESNKHNKTNKQLTREVSTNLPSLIVPLKNENENDFLTEQSLFYNNAYSIEKKQKKNLEQLINFFNEIGLNEEYTKILSTNGFDDLNLLIEQTKNGIAMTDENLKEIGIKKPGIRAKIFIHLEELSKLFDFPIEKEKVYYKNDRNKNCLYRFLSSINLEFYLNNFIDNEYTSPELLFVQMKCKQPITEDFLFKEIGIDKIGYRMRILNKIKNESCNYFYKLKNGILGKNKVFGENNTIFFEKKNDGINSNNDFCNMCSIV